MKRLTRWIATPALGGAVLLGACSDVARTPFEPIPLPSATLATSNPAEEIYLSDNQGGANANNGSRLYQVELIGADAQLTLLKILEGNCATTPIDCSTAFDQVHIAAAPDGSVIYVVNQRAGNAFGIYDVASGDFVHVGFVDGLPAEGTVLAGVSPAGEYFVANQTSNRLYRVDLGTLQVVESWLLPEVGGGNLPLLGADLAFDASGNLFIWTNAGGLGLYQVSFSDGVAEATRIGTGTYPFVTGLAIRDHGNGNLLGSSSETNEIFEISPTTGDILAVFPMKLEGTSFDHRGGDMTVGLLQLPTGGEGCTPGYWRQSHHFGSWVGYSPDQLFSSVFEDAFSGMTLLQVLEQGGGGLGALGRHTVAALLNAASPDVGYDLTEAQVIQKFNDVFPGGDYEALKDEFEQFNEQGCPL